MATHSANSSPFHSLRGIHPGSSFKALPPRLYPNLREDSASSCASVTSMTCPSPGSSKMSTSSPRMVPLTVLSRNGSGSPAASPMKNTPSIPPFDLSQQSPLMRSLDGLAKDSTADLLSPALAQPKLEEAKTPGKGAEESPLSSDESLRLLPRIKLTPRGKRNCATSKADESPGASSDLTMPALSGMGGLGAMPSPARERGLNLTSPPRERRGLHTKPASSFLTNSPGDKEAAEMDLLSGFEHHQPGSCGEVASRGKAGTKGVPFHEAAMGDLSRIESEEAEIASLTQGPLHGPFWPHPMPPPKPEPSESRRSSLVCSDDEEGSCASYRPMPSITFDMSEQTEVPTSTGPSFLPRVPVATRKCRSLFSPVCTEEDPIESIMRADAIAEAAKSSEPLTDDDSDGEGGDFLLCLPSTSHEKEDSQGEGDEERKSPFNSIEPFGFLSESPSFSRRAESPLLTKSLSGSLTSRRRQCSNQSLRGLASPMTPTILEEGTTVPSAGESGRFGSDPFHRLGPLEGMGRRETSDATFTTFCSLSDGEASEMMSSPKFIPAKALGGRKQSTASLLSTSSLRGLDIVHEASTSSADGAVDRVPVLLPSGSSEFSVPMFKSLRSELSMNSLGLSVDSASEDTGRDLYTPIAMGPLNGRPMLSPPPLRGRVASPLPFDGNRWK